MISKRTYSHAAAQRLLGGEGMRYFETVFITMAIFFAVATPARADWREFVPKLYGLPTAELGMTSAFMSEVQKGSVDLKLDSIRLRETLTVSTAAYIYDPRFIFLNLSGTFGFSQEEFTSNGSSSGWLKNMAREYSLGIYVLPTHPYNLYLFATRNESEESGGIVQPHITETTEGAVFRYKKKPYYANVRYVRDSFETTDGDSTVNLLEGTASYVKDYKSGISFFLNGSYTHSSFSSSQSLSGSSDSFGVDNSIGYKWIRLGSNLRKNILREDSSDGQLKNETLSWSEALSAVLPLNFNASLSYEFSKSTSTSGDSFFYPGGELSSTGKNWEFSLTHQLYQSLRSSYSYVQRSSDGPFGQMDQKDHILNFLYRKSIPTGRLDGALNLTRQETDNLGRTAVVNEPHIATSVPGSFTLGRDNAELSSVKVYLRSPLPSNELLLLTENVDYIVVPFANTFEVSILNLPSQFILPGSFDFYVSYYLKQSDFKMRTDTFSYSVSLTLLNGLLNPYYAYGKSTSDMISGALPYGAEAIESTSHSAGINFHKGPFGGGLHYQRTISNLNSSTSWRGDISYSESIAQDTTLYASARYSLTNYPRGTSLYENSQGFTQKEAFLNANVTKWVPLWRFNLSGGLILAYQDAQTKSTSYSGNIRLSWIIGKMSLTAGASISRSETEGTNLLSGAASRVRVERLHQFYSLSIHRRLP